MKFEHIKIACAGLAANGTKLLVNGEELENVTAYRLEADVNGVTMLTLTLHAPNVEVDGEAVVERETDAPKRCPFPQHADDCDCDGAGGDR